MKNKLLFLVLPALLGVIMFITPKTVYADTPTPIPSATPWNPFVQTPMSSMYGCPLGTPSGYGTVTPSAIWKAMCQTCIAYPTTTATPASIPVCPPLPTVNPLVTSTPGVTPTPGACHLATVTPLPSPTFTPTPYSTSTPSASGTFTGNPSFSVGGQGAVIIDSAPGSCSKSADNTSILCTGSVSDHWNYSYGGGNGQANVYITGMDKTNGSVVYETLQFTAYSSYTNSLDLYYYSLGAASPGGLVHAYCNNTAANGCANQTAVAGLYFTGWPQSNSFTWRFTASTRAYDDSNGVATATPTITPTVNPSYCASVDSSSGAGGLTNNTTGLNFGTVPVSTTCSDIGSFSISSILSALNLGAISSSVISATGFDAFTPAIKACLVGYTLSLKILGYQVPIDWAVALLLIIGIYNGVVSGFRFGAEMLNNADMRQRRKK